MIPRKRIWPFRSIGHGFVKGQNILDNGQESSQQKRFGIQSDLWI